MGRGSDAQTVVAWLEVKQRLSVSGFHTQDAASFTVFGELCVPVLAEALQRGTRLHIMFPCSLVSLRAAPLLAP